MIKKIIVSVIFIFLIEGELLYADAPYFYLDSLKETIYEDLFYQKNINFKDNDNDSVFFELVDSPEGVKIFQVNDTVIQLTWTPDNSNVGYNNFRIIIKDTTSLSDTLYVQLYVQNINDPPEFQIDTLIDTLWEDQKYQKNIGYSDPDNNIDHFDTLYIPANMKLQYYSNYFSIEWTPVYQNVGRDSLKLILWDDSLKSDTLYCYFEILETDDAPDIAIDTLLDTLWEDKQYSKKINVYDEDDSVFHYQIIYKPDSLKIDSVTSSNAFYIDWTPRNEDVGDDSLEIIVFDDSLKSDTLFAKFHVKDVNDFPVPGEILFPENLSTVRTDTFSFILTKAIDPDIGDSVLYQLIFSIDDSAFTFDNIRRSEWFGTNEDTIKFKFDYSFPEDKWIYFTVRIKDDSLFYSSYDTIKFFVNTYNSIPEFQLLSPGDSEMVRTNPPNFTVGNVVDSDDSVFYYSFRLLDTNFYILSTIRNIPDSSMIFDYNFEENEAYYWTARVKDLSGDSSSWKVPSLFYINEREEPPYTPENFWIVGLDSVGHYVKIKNPTFVWNYKKKPDPDPLTGNNDIRAIVKIYIDTTIPPIDTIISNYGTNYALYSRDLLKEHVKYFASITAFDKTNLYSERSEYLQFSIELQNDKPQIISQPVVYAFEDIEYLYNFKVYDEEKDSVNIIFFHKPDGMYVDTSYYYKDTLNYVIKWIPTALQIGIQPVEIGIIDQMDRIVKQSFNILVSNTNDPPVLIYPPEDTSFNIRANDTLNIQLISYDEDEGDSVRFEFIQFPQWLNIDSIYSKIDTFFVSLKGMPLQNDIGSSVLEYKMVDDSAAVEHNKININVLQPNSPPLAPILLFPMNNSIIRETNRPTLVIQASKDVDPEDSILTYTIELSSKSDFSQITAIADHLQSDSGTVSWLVPLELSENTYYFWRAKAIDTHGLSSEYSSIFTFFINRIDDPPEVPEIIYPKDNIIIHNLDSTNFFVKNPYDPDTPIDSLIGIVKINYLEDGDLFYYGNNIKFSLDSDTTSINLKSLFTADFIKVENRAFYWYFGVKEENSSIYWSLPDTFKISFIDEPPEAPKNFNVYRDITTLTTDSVLLETPNNYVFFKWFYNNAKDPEDNQENIFYRIYIYHNNQILDTLVTKPNTFQINSYVDNNLVSDGFTLIDNLLYNAKLVAVDMNNNESEGVWSIPFIYNKKNEPPFTPVIDSTSSFNDSIVKDTIITLYFHTKGDPDYTDSLASLKFNIEISNDSDFITIYKRYLDLGYNQLNLVGIKDGIFYLSYDIPEALENYSYYYFRVNAFDNDNSFSEWSNYFKVFIQSGNRIPNPPQIIFPEDSGELTNTNIVTVKINPATDPDGDDLLYKYLLYELTPEKSFFDSSEFISSLSWSSDLILSENSFYKILVYSYDGKTVSIPDSTIFAINQIIEPPTVPQLFRIKNLTSGYISYKTPLYLWEPSVDLDPFDNKRIYYRISLFSDFDTIYPIKTYITNKGESSYQTPDNEALIEDKTYFARIKAIVDFGNQQSRWSDAIMFKVNSVQSPPHITLADEFTESDVVVKGIVPIKWYAYDSDGDSINIQIEYSGDNGVSWRLLPEIDAHGDSMFENDSVYYWNSNDSYVIYGNKNSQLRISATDGISEPVSVYSNFFTIIKPFGPQPKIFSPGDEITRINFTLDRPGKVTIKIFNIAQRLVRTLVEDQYFDKKDNFVEWDGRDDDGNILPNRIYFIVIKKPDGKKEFSSVVIMKK